MSMGRSEEGDGSRCFRLGNSLRRTVIVLDVGFASRFHTVIATGSLLNCAC